MAIKELTLRSTKASQLTTNEGDNNFLSAKAGRKNLLLNPRFALWQEGTSFTTDGHCASLWRMDLGGGSGTVSRQSHTLGQTDVPLNPEYYLQWNQTGGGTTVYLEQRIEDVATASSINLTYSFWAKVSTGTVAVTPSFRQDFGSGGSPSSDVTTTGTAQTVTTSWTKFTETISVPSVSGKTKGSNGDDYLAFRLTLPNSSTFVLSVADVQVEYGTEATDIEVRSTQEEVNLVSRYWEASYQLEDKPGDTTADGAEWLVLPANVADGDDFPSSVRFRVPKRSDPTVTFYSYDSGTSGQVVEDVSSTATDRDATAIGISKESFKGFNNGSGSTISSGNSVAIHWVADARL